MYRLVNIRNVDAPNRRSSIPALAADTFTFRVGFSHPVLYGTPERIEADDVGVHVHTDKCVTVYPWHMVNWVTRNFT